MVPASTLSTGIFRASRESARSATPDRAAEPLAERRHDARHEDDFDPRNPSCRFGPCEHTPLPVRSRTCRRDGHRAASSRPHPGPARTRARSLRRRASPGRPSPTPQNRRRAARPQGFRRWRARTFAALRPRSSRARALGVVRRRSVAAPLGLRRGAREPRRLATIPAAARAASTASADRRAGRAERARDRAHSILGEVERGQSLRAGSARGVAIAPIERLNTPAAPSCCSAIAGAASATM